MNIRSPVFFIQTNFILYEIINGNKYTRVILPDPLPEGGWENRH